MLPAIHRRLPIGKRFQKDKKLKEYAIFVFMMAVLFFGLCLLDLHLPWESAAGESVSAMRDIFRVEYFAIFMFGLAAVLLSVLTVVQFIILMNTIRNWRERRKGLKNG